MLHWKNSLPVHFAWQGQSTGGSLLMSSTPSLDGDSKQLQADIHRHQEV